MTHLPGRKEKFLLINYLKNEHLISDRMSPKEVFVFLINPPAPAPAPSGKAEIQKLIAKHVFECFKMRKEREEKKTK